MTTTTPPTLGKYGVALENEAAVQAYIDLIEGRATQRCISADRLVRAAAGVEARLGTLGVRMKDRPGIAVHIDGSEHLPSSYGHGAHATFTTITRRTAGWYLTSVSREWNRPRNGNDVEGISDAVLADAARRYLGGR